ncbi:MAG: FtsH protease activity modulator HflK [Planctomycetaceae bacterium]|nr:FtsH protease activity modulator HflK [Planctomycetaceae bacterium]MBN8604235.1 FtsH protease activity modulator HflK [Planctomycetota bacterium]
MNSKFRKEIEPNLDTQQVLTGLAAVVALSTILYFAWSGFYTVREYEKAVVLRWGKYYTTAEPGLHFKLPWIDERILVDCSERTLRLPWGTAELVQRGAPLTVERDSPEEMLILTGDLYAAVVEWNVIWRVSEPRDFALRLNDDDADNIINAVARSTMHRIIGDYAADEILTGKREEIALAALAELKSNLESLKSGIMIVDLQMQRAIPPDRVKPAFDEVNASIQQRDKLVNEARRERNQMLPLALASQDKSIREAEGYASRRKAEAEGEIAALLAKYAAYQKAPELTRRRLYLETMERVLGNSGPKVILDGSMPSPLPLLPLEKE